jgi:tight adherence protein C
MNPETLQLAFYAAAFATALAVIVAVQAVLRARTEAAAADDDEFPAPDGRTETDPVRRVAPQGRLAALAELTRPKSLAELSELRRRLARAGLRSDNAVEIFSIARAVSLIVGVTLGALLMLTGEDGSEMLMSALCMALGYYAPEGWLKGRIEARQSAITEALPPTIDLLVTCMEAGLGLEQAIARVSREVSHSDPEMSEELGIVVGEIRAGLGVPEAFRKLSDRVTSDDMRNLAQVVGQAAQLGAALGRTMREYANSARRRRTLALEETAGKITARLTLPLTLCLMPAALIIMLGPAIVMIFRMVST